ERLRIFVGAAKERSTADGFRLPVDRAFSLAGVGTVVTGTTWSGTVAIGEEVALFPLGARGRVRSIEAYGAGVAAATPATRTAIGLAGIDRAAVKRGDVLLGGQVPWRATTGFDAEISLMSSAPRALALGTRVRVHLGTAEVLARVKPRGDIRPGETGLARVVLEAPIVARGQDRFVIRSYSPVTTIGGGRVIDPDPPARSTWPEGLTAADPARRLEALLARRPLGVRKAEVSLLLGLPPREAESVAKRLAAVRGIGDHWVPTTTLRDLTERATRQIEAHHRINPEDKGLSLETVRQALRAPEWITTQVLGDLERAQKIRVQAGLASLPDFEQTFRGGSGAVDRVVARIKAAGLEAPTLEDLAAELGLPNLATLVRHAAELGTLVPVERNRYFHREALDRFRAAVRELGKAGEISPAGLRERLGLTRKYLIPLLEWSDRAGLTRRIGDRRVLENPID
ncbi:MAG: SelB C-terminal domain-containing protein, partial [Gemmatimonadota bacterium]